MQLIATEYRYLKSLYRSMCEHNIEMCINQAYRICLNLFNNSQVLKTKSFTGIFNLLLLPRIDKDIYSLI